MTEEVYLIPEPQSTRNLSRFLALFKLKNALTNLTQDTLGSLWSSIRSRKRTLPREHIPTLLDLLCFIPSFATSLLLFGSFCCTEGNPLIPLMTQRRLQLSVRLVIHPLTAFSDSLLVSLSCLLSE